MSRGCPSAALAAQLDTAQAPAFVIATVSLTALSAGDAGFQIFSTTLDEPRESFSIPPTEIPFDLVVPAVTIAPEPSIAALLGLVWAFWIVIRPPGARRATGDLRRF